ncbi:hypothetical protein OV203_41610 [Nannocystis sp. ILAH1]|uniref:hypothetical protein n=1 Tax=unclassified Nannocystis TaxID=2627009 RepID=UPI00226FE4D7|nr:MULTISPECIES: hypothetical protein [unclassified Nannocystis]MCY0993708.1 hypothetical protein [Nannocystis sp. ILAH1]MCY1065929.1 hypothetical protein [Nannocystis sp. RBIL2]
MRASLFAVALFGCRVQSSAQATPTTPPAPRTMGEQCRSQGFDFAFDDRDLGEENVLMRCGKGPGTPCERQQRHCAGRILVRCDAGRLADLDCSEWCRHSSAVMSLDVDGTCGERDGTAECVCCAAGEPPCPSEPTPIRSVPMSPPME